LNHSPFRQPLIPWFPLSLCWIWALKKKK
jgi:hypothetical protein